MSEQINVEIGIAFDPMTLYPLNNPGMVFRSMGGEKFVQPKFNGIRCVLHKKGDQVWLFSSHKKDMTDKFPEIVKSAKEYLGDFVLDGELIVWKNKECDFKGVVRQLWDGKTREKNVFVAFDILYYDDQPVYRLPYMKRRSALEEIPQSNRIIIVPEKKVSDGEKLKEYYIECIKNKFEGIVIKNLYHDYVFERTPQVRKLKPVRTVDLRVVEVLDKINAFNRYTVELKEGLVCVIPTTKQLQVGDIIVVKYDCLIESQKYPLGFSLMHARFVHKHPTKLEPDSEVTLKC